MLSPEERLERRREASARWAANNPEKVNAKKRRCRAADPERYREINKAYDRRNPEKKREYNRRWYHANKERAKETARAWHAANPGYIRKRHLKAKYNMAPAEWEAMFEAQGRSCAVCPAAESGNKLGWSTDHDRATGKVRGILCHGCNQALGGAKDNPETLRALAAYIERSQRCGD